MKKLAPLLSALVLAVCAGAQSPPITLPKNFCSDYASATLACKSFKELVEPKDEEMLAILGQHCRAGGGGNGGATYVCFKEGEDKFLVVSFNMPERWEKTAHSYLKGESLLCLDEYANGIPGGSQDYSSLEWIKFDCCDPSEGMSPVTGKLFDKEGHVTPGEVAATVDPSEISVRYSFPNKRGSTTDYKLMIRRSTRRFVETYNTGSNTYTETGHCAEFKGKSK